MLAFRKAMHINDVVAQQDDIHLLGGAQVEQLAADQHLQDVNACPHPAGVMGGFEPKCHLQSRDLAAQKLKTCVMLIY